MFLRLLRSYMYEWLVNTQMPLRLVFVRHGLSEGNVANELIRKGHYDEIPAEMHGVPGWKWRLAELGCEQAVQTGEWLREYMPAGFDVGFSSPFIRAKETAGLLGNIGSSPEFRWKVNPVIRERDYGRLDKIPYPKELEGHLKYLEGRTIERLFWPPPGGESIQRVQPRADRFFATLHRHYSDKSVMAVAHGDFILAAILEICRMSYEEFEERKKQRDPFLHIENCQIVEFTRVDPVTGEVADHLDWVRSICPWDPNWEASACASWQRIERRTYSPGELLTQARQQPRYF